MNQNRVFRKIGENMRAGAAEGWCAPPKSDGRKLVHGTATCPTARAGRRGGSGDKRQRRALRKRYSHDLPEHMKGTGLMSKLLSFARGRVRARYGNAGNHSVHRRDLK